MTTPDAWRTRARASRCKDVPDFPAGRCNTALHTQSTIAIQFPVDSENGLVSTKSDVLEDANALKARIDAAAKYIDLDQLAVSPQCGFASVDIGNPISPATQEAKLRRVVEVAREVWGQG